MSKSKKTLKVKETVQKLNIVLLHSPDKAVEFREGIIFAIEELLHSSGNYSGFRYLSMSDVDSVNNKMPGIREWKEKEECWNFEDTDRTRVAYYC